MSEALLAIMMKLTLSIMGHAEATLLFAGDAMMHQGQIDAAYSIAGGRGYDYSQCFNAVQPFVEKADYAVVNLETPLGKRNFTGYPCFNAPVSYATALKDAGFDLFLTANNHTLDRLDRGLKYTIEALDSLQIPHIGTYKSAQARQEAVPFIVNIRGFRVAFMNYTYGTNGISVQGDAVVNYINRDVIKAEVDSARAAGAEIVVAAMHWGVEYVLLPVASQKSLANYLLSIGVDAVIGGHPHVVEPYEMRTNSATGKKAAVVYSLGNFISNMKTCDTRGGAMAEVRLKRDSQGVAYVDTCMYHLVYTVPPSATQRNFMVYPIDDVPSAWKWGAAAFRNALR